MKGTIWECLVDYLGTLTWGVKGCGQNRKPLADFVGVSISTPRRWLRDKKCPTGLHLMKLRYFLESRGYEITGLCDIQEPIRSVGRLIAFGKISIGEVSSMAGYSHIDELMRVLHGKFGISSTKRKIFESIYEKFSEEAPKQLAEVKKAGKIPVDASSKELMGFLHCINTIFDLLEPKLENFLSNSVSPEQRQKFRQEAGRKLVFELANRFHLLTNMMNSLCSEKSREINQKKNREAK